MKSEPTIHLQHPRVSYPWPGCMSKDVPRVMTHNIGNVSCWDCAYLLEIVPHGDQSAWPRKELPNE